MNRSFSNCLLIDLMDLELVVFATAKNGPILYYHYSKVIQKSFSITLNY